MYATIVCPGPAGVVGVADVVARATSRPRHVDLRRVMVLPARQA
ncbi:hypothetical protein [Streptomyces sp. NPDC001135]